MAALFAALESGDRPVPSHWLELVPPPSPDSAAVVSFSGHVVVAADVTRSWLDAHVPADDFGAPTEPRFLTALEDLLGVRAGCLDVMLMAAPLPGPPPIPLTLITDADHPRVKRALRYRSQVQVWSGPQGLLVLGRGLAGRWEMAFEVPQGSRGKGFGRALAVAARHLLPSYVWAQCSPGNVISLRALLAAGYVPQGSEILLTRT